MFIQARSALRAGLLAPAAWAAGLLLLAGCAGGAEAQPSGDAARKEIEAFNREFQAATLRMDNAALTALWAEDGVDLLPGMEPMKGRQAIRKWLDDVVRKLPGYKVVKQENEFQEIQVSGDWAWEWGKTHQVVQPPGGRPPAETRGKILLVLHREKSGAWKIRMEMWTPGAPR